MVVFCFPPLASARAEAIGTTIEWRVVKVKSLEKWLGMRLD
jgi:hypothetical protein